MISSDDLDVISTPRQQISALLWLETTLRAYATRICKC